MSRYFRKPLLLLVLVILPGCGASGPPVPKELAGKWISVTGEPNLDVEYRSNGTWIQYMGRSGSFKLTGPEGKFRVIDASTLEIDGVRVTYKIEKDALEVIYPEQGWTRRYRRAP